MLQIALKNKLIAHIIMPNSVMYVLTNSVYEKQPFFDLQIYTVLIYSKNFLIHP